MEHNMSYSGQIYVPPINTTFTALNSASITTVGDRYAMSVPAQSANTDNVVGGYVAAPAAPYCLIANVIINPGDYTNQTNPGSVFNGVGFYDGTKLLYLNCTFNSTHAGINVTSYSSVHQAVANLSGNFYSGGYPSDTINWFQLRDDGTNIYFYIATDAGNEPPTHWVKIYSQGRSAYLSAPTNIFWAADAQINAVASAYLTLNSWQTVSL